MVCQVTLVGGAAVYILEIAVRRNSSVDGILQLFGGGRRVKAKLHRARGCGREVTSKSCRTGSLVPINNAAERPSLVREARRMAARLESAELGKYILRSNSPGRSTFA